MLVGDHEHIAFRYTEDWTAERAKDFLGKRIGWMQVDGYGGYEQIANEGMALLVGCWMHCRRYWVKAFDAKDLRAVVPLKMIGRLYEIERESKPWILRPATFLVPVWQVAFSAFVALHLVREGLDRPRRFPLVTYAVFLRPDEARRVIGWVRHRVRI